MRPYFRYVAIRVILVLAVVPLSGCGREEQEPAEGVPYGASSRPDTLELVLVDTLGVEMGDSPDVFASLVQVAH
ncbi:hypothetical protein JW921_06145, partial [Candidatus Fermentibacterales bacterium]|nr:hypothetical protein [Candidatus Fermentibacterales bacterium]